MQDHCETIMIKGQDGSPLRINVTDFKAGEHELYEAPVGKSDDDADDTKAAAKNTAPVQQPAGQPRGAAKPA